LFWENGEEGLPTVTSGSCVTKAPAVADAKPGAANARATAVPATSGGPDSLQMAVPLTGGPEQSLHDGVGRPAAVAVDSRACSSRTEQRLGGG
jgi:hypothetical protein